LQRAASVHALRSVSVPGVPSFGVHLPLVAPRPPLHWSVGGHVLLVWLWSQTPAPLQPAVVHALPSVSGHGTLSCSNMWFCTHTPRAGLVGLSSQPASVQMLRSACVHGVLVFGVHCPLVVSQPPLHSSAPGHVLVTCFWSHTPAPLQPAVVHASPSASGHGTLSCSNMWFCAHTPSS